MFELRDYQKDAIQRTLSWLQQRDCNPLIIIPTGGGKSVTIADLCRQLTERDPATRIVVSTDVRELAEQNYDEIKGWWPEAKLGMCSVGLGREELHQPITVGTIQTLANRWWAFDNLTHVIVDEAHMIPRNIGSRYQRFIRGVATKVGHRIPLVGLTATPYRLDSGLLHRGKGALFDVIAANVPVQQLIQDGYLVPLVNQRMPTQIDTSNMRIKGYDFEQASMDKEVAKQNITAQALRELIAQAGDRRSWLLFAVSIRHAMEIGKILNRAGISARVISSETSKTERDQTVQDFRQGLFRAIISVNILTKGFNVSHIDLIAMLRPTLSTGLYVQMLGRGMRLAIGKLNCLVMDFGGNIARHGPLNELRIQREEIAPPKITGAGKQKICPSCDNRIHIFARTCPICGHLFSDVTAMAEIDHPVLDMDLTPPEPPKTPDEIVKEYIRIHKIGNDPFIDHLRDMRNE